MDMNPAGKPKSHLEKIEKIAETVNELTANNKYYGIELQILLHMYTVIMFFIMDWYAVNKRELDFLK
jgi:hypothetical protein